MQQSSAVIRNYLLGLELGQPQNFRNLSAVPLLSADTTDLNYLLLDEAQDMVKISEVTDEGAVSELKVLFESEKMMLLLLDGESITGASLKQNRILNSTMLIGKTATIPVSCCEAQKWSYDDSSSSSSGNRLAYRTLRARKSEHVSESLRGGSFHSNQSEVWSLISERMHKRHARSASSDMGSIYEADLNLISDYMAGFFSTDCQVGAIFFINGVVSGIECFGKQDTFKKVAQKVCESYVLDAIAEADSKIVTDSVNLEVKGRQFIQRINDSGMEIHAGAGDLGQDIRFTNLAGSAFLFQNYLLHLSAFPMETASPVRTRLQRSSMRRNRRLH